MRNKLSLHQKEGGLACYVSDAIKYSDTSYSHLNQSTKHIEMQWIELSIDNIRPIMIVNVYRPPQGDYKTACKLILESIDKADLKDNTEIYMLGDFNIDFKPLNSKSPAFKELDFTAKALGLTQLINDPTRIQHRNGLECSSTLDLIFTNSEFVKEAQVLDINISDHLSVLVRRKKKWKKLEKISFKGRSYKNYIREDFQDNLVNHNWDGFFEIEDPSSLWGILSKVITDTINPMCPMKSFKVREAGEPWLTNEALEAIRDKDNLLRKAKRTKNELDWVNAKESRNRVGRDLRNLRSEYLMNQQTLHKNDPKKFWSTISSIIPGKKDSSKLIWLKDEESEQDIDQAKVSHYMNSFFTSIGPGLAKKHTQNWVYFGDRLQNSLEHIQTDVDEVVELLKEIEYLKSSGLEEISSRICKDAFLVLHDHLTHIFNCSLRLGLFPDQWKIARVVPLSKGGDRTIVGNYRPISLLPLPGKILEKIVHDRISSFLDKENFLSPDQGGFRAGCSTTATIADITDDIFSNVNGGLTTLAAFIDLKKAFDTVNFEILLCKLDASGIRGGVYQWCRSYLLARSQSTMANGVPSPNLSLKCGVLQGSVLGPLFFFIYML